VRRLDFPVILEMFHPARRDTCYLALIQVTGDQAVVASAGTRLTVPLADVDRLWTRQTVFLWHDFDALLGTLREPGATAWAMAELGRMGYSARASNPGATVAEFQRRSDLSPDGILGERTLMAIYGQGPYKRPRLSGGFS
jgi:hypothetical protein